MSWKNRHQAQGKKIETGFTGNSTDSSLLTRSSTPTSSVSRDRSRSASGNVEPKTALKTETDNDSPLLKSMLQSTKSELPNSPKVGDKRKVSGCREIFNSTLKKKSSQLNPRRPIASDFINGPRETGLKEPFDFPQFETLSNTLRVRGREF